MIFATSSVASSWKMTVCLIVGAVLMPDVAAAQARDSRCMGPRDGRVEIPRNARLVAASEQVRVYRYGSGPNFDYRTCARATGDTYPIAHYRDFADHIVVAGRYVAYFYDGAADDSSPALVQVLDTASKRYSSPLGFDTYDYVGPNNVSMDVKVTDLALTREGAVAWIGTRLSPDATLEVHSGRYVRKIGVFGRLSGSLALVLSP